ncbi:hypothetical protein [Pseudomonas viridiflava]|uniref:hypothetical protein n=1 Tax=Pseudomonas viridiflava TaxID=33069 RepID=UPI000F036AAD|nr:hypothetical protein [Pseudomonas viridiflava]
MNVDIEKIEALAKGCRDEVIRSHGWTGMIADAGLLRRDSEFLKECSPEAVLDLIASGKRMASRLMYCPACQGEGEVYSGRNSYEGYNQPPEPIMNKCGECDGDGALGDTAECISILDEVETLRAENAGLKTGYEAYERVNAELRAECEKLRAKILSGAARAKKLVWIASNHRRDALVLRKDAERREWEGFNNGLTLAGNLRPSITHGDDGGRVLNDIRCQIDEAMRKDQSHD